jgi:hypothetical protein
MAGAGLLVSAGGLYAQTYCGGSWNAACASAAVVADEFGNIRIEMIAVPNADGRGDADNIVFTRFVFQFTDDDGNALRDSDGDLLRPTWGASGEGGTGTSGFEEGPKSVEGTDDEFFSLGDWGNGGKWNVDVIPDANGLCGGLVPNPDNDPNPPSDWSDDLPGNCNKNNKGGYYQRVVFTFAFGDPTLTGVDARTDINVMWAAQAQNICGSSGDDDCIYSDWASIPEPITTVLVGSGLLGLGGAGWIRRRRRGVEDL